MNLCEIILIVAAVVLPQSLAISSCGIKKIEEDLGGFQAFYIRMVNDIRSIFANKFHATIMNQVELLEPLESSAKRCTAAPADCYGLVATIKADASTPSNIDQAMDLIWEEMVKEVNSLNTTTLLDVYAGIFVHHTKKVGCSLDFVKGQKNTFVCIGLGVNFKPFYGTTCSDCPARKCTATMVDRCLQPYRRTTAMCKESTSLARKRRPRWCPRMSSDGYALVKKRSHAFLLALVTFAWSRLGPSGDHRWST